MESLSLSQPNLLRSSRVKNKYNSRFWKRSFPASICKPFSQRNRRPSFFFFYAILWDFEFSILRLLIIRGGRKEGPRWRVSQRKPASLVPTIFVREGFEGIEDTPPPLVNSPNAWLRLRLLAALPILYDIAGLD